MKKVIFSLINKYPIKNIENAFIQAFLENHNIIVMNNLLLLEIMKDCSEVTQKIKQEISSPKTIYELEKIFELLIPTSDRKLNGAFFTPCSITNYIADELITNPNQKICDPSCGCGAFLIAAIEKIKHCFDKPVSEIIEENIYGIDILEYSVRRCKILLSILALLNNQDVKTIKFNIYTQNSLGNNLNCFDDILDAGGFDTIIGNPPYVKYQDLSIDIRNELLDNWTTIQKGNYNLYFAFFELGINLLKENGHLGYIVPNSYFTSIAGINLRSYLQSNRYISKIIDFTHLKIFDVQTYTCITFLQKKKNSSFLFEKIDDKTELMNLKELSFSLNKFENIDNKKWRLLRNQDYDNIKKIENMPYKLGNVADIRVGIATCKDAIYFIDGTSLKDGFYTKTYNNVDYKIEHNITRVITKISDFSDENTFKNNSRRIIFPYNTTKNGATIIQENILKEKYPECYKYFLAVKTELATRDKGHVEYPEWYAYARTQGLNFEGEKLLTPTFSEKPRFLYDNDESSLFCNGYAIYAKNINQQSLFDTNFGLSILQKILNSSIMDYYIKTTSVSIEGGYPCYQKNFIELFGLPQLSSDEIIYLEKELNKKSIDEFLTKKYNLSFKQINATSEPILINI